MPKFNKPTPEKINTIWATNAVTGDIVEIDTSKIQQGWAQEKPPYESENWINQQHDQYIAYINQLGIPEWDQYTEYQAGKSYVQGSNNLTYKCIQTHTNKNPATAGNESFWKRFAQEATESSNLITIFQTLFPVGSTVGRPTNPGNTIANGGLGFGTWTKIEGRSLIGEGSYTDSRGENKTFSRGSSQGEYRHVLTESENAPHKHRYNTTTGFGGNTPVFKDTSFDKTSPNQEAPGTGDFPETVQSGNGDPHNNIHPVFAAPLWYRTA